jgi:hypothetical protein
MQPIISLMLSGSQFILQDFPLCLPPFFPSSVSRCKFGSNKIHRKIASFVEFASSSDLDSSQNFHLPIAVRHRVL